MKAAPKKSTFKPGKGKTWADKLSADKKPEVKRTDKKFADIPEGGLMLIATPKIIDEYVRQIPKGKSVDLLTMRKDLAQEYRAEYTCPVTTGIFLRIVSEAAHEQLEKGASLNKVTPFWRVVNEKSSLAKKLSFGSDLIIEQRKKEGIEKFQALRKKSK
jgi:hypothetical protein